MATEPEGKDISRQHLADEHPELPDDVLDGLAELSQVNTDATVDRDVDAQPATAEEHADAPPSATDR